MKNKIISGLLLLSATIFSSSLFAQDWVSKMKDPTVNFFEVQRDFNRYYEKKERQMERQMRKALRKSGSLVNEEEFEVPGYIQFKRWEWFMAPRVAQTGERFEPSLWWTEYRKYRQQFQTLNAGNWTFMGPGTSASLAGAGRLNFVRIHPSDPNTLFVGSPSGGLWKTTNGGTTWTTNTDQLSQVIGCTDIAIDPLNPNIMYLATGDGDAGDTYSVGVLKSTDGGATWNTTGLSFYAANTRQLSKILINPSNTNNIIVATSAGIYFSDDAAATFTNVQIGSFKDLEFKPNDPNTVYACGGEFYKSANGGQNWTKITSGLPSVANVSRMATAVTEADPDIVYMIVGLPAPNYGTEGFYKSINSGTSFTNPSTPGLGSQQWYDLCIDASPTNANEIILGGQTDFLRSTNGGSNWSDVGGNTHVDYHDIVFINGSSFYTASDGGLYRTTNSGASWTNLNNNLAISQMYGFGQSATNPNLLINGWQDNGTNRYDGSWDQILGGDGMLCFIDWNNDNNMWAEYYEGNLQRSTNGGGFFTSAMGNINEVGAWVTPWLQDPVNAGTIYAGFVNVWRSNNGGVSWTKLSTFSNTGTLNAIAVSPANNQVLWAAKAGALYKSSNGGSSWTTITNVPSGTITGIACSNTDANKAWICYSGFTNANKVFQTGDQGASWTNLSPSIPNIPVNCITYMNGSNDALYIGTDVGVFFKDAGLSVWQPFFNGLPNVIVTQLSIFYPTGKIRASTYGRGMWESDLYVPGSYPPSAAFSTTNIIGCPGLATQFSDYSAGQPTSWNWTFPGGNPSSSTQQNPLVFYNTPGTFPVTLEVTNAIGNNIVTYNNYITVSSSPVSAPSTSGASVCAPATANLTATGSGQGTLRWWDAPGGGNMVATGNSYSPFVNGTTTYYVDEELPPGAFDFVGEANTGIGAGSFFTANDIRGLYFDVLSPVVVNSMDVFSNSAGNRTIEILDAQGNTVIDTTIFIPASPSAAYTVNVNFVLYPGTNYFIKCRGLVDLYRNSSGAVYPYFGTNINITGSNAGSPGYYYFFYNWIYTAMTCNSARSPVTALDTCALGINQPVTQGGYIDVIPNPNHGIFTIKADVITPGTYAIQILNSIGEIVHMEKLIEQGGKLEKKIDIGRYGSGIYLLRLSGSGGEVSERKLIIY